MNNMNNMNSANKNNTKNNANNINNLKLVAEPEPQFENYNDVTAAETASTPDNSPNPYRSPFGLNDVVKPIAKPPGTDISTIEESKESITPDNTPPASPKEELKEPKNKKRKNRFSRLISKLTRKKDKSNKNKKSKRLH